MGVETIAFIPMSQVNSVAEFVQSLKNSINDMVKESYFENKVGTLYETSIPFVLNQSKIRNFEYDVAGGREHFRAIFSVFVPSEQFNSKNAHQIFELPDGTPIHAENEARMMAIFPNNYDHNDTFDGPKMTIQLSRWGLSCEIIKRVMNDYGADYYFTSNDCDNDFELISASSNKEVV